MGERTSVVFKTAILVVLAVLVLLFLQRHVVAWVKNLDSLEQKLFFALGGFIVAPITPLFTNWVQCRAQNRQALTELKNLRRPMITAIGNLLWRLSARRGLLAFLPGMAVSNEHLLGIHAGPNVPHSKKDYLIHDTVYQVALLFYWMRRIREEFHIKGILGPFAKDIERANDALAWSFSESYRVGGRTAFEVYAGQRDAIAALMQDNSDSCKIEQPIAYGEFRRRLEKDPDGMFARWFQHLLRDVKMIIDASIEDDVKDEQSPDMKAWTDGSLERIQNIVRSGEGLLEAVATPTEIAQMAWLKNLLHPTGEAKDDLEKALSIRPGA